MAKSGEQFIHIKNTALHNSQEVEDTVSYLRAGGEKIPNSPEAKLQSYLGFLANKEYVNDGVLTGDKQSIDRQISTHIISPDKVPDSYFELQRRIAREQGHGDIKITDGVRNQLIEAIVADQRSSLSKWAEYIGGPDGTYPQWFEYYVWESVTNLGMYNKEKGEFTKRTESTVAPYPELNHEALAYVYDKLKKSLNEEVADEPEQLQKLLRGGNFGKLYAHALLRAAEAKETLNTTQGSWKKFDQTDDPRTARRLSQSLEAYATGWCTAGESTAYMQLKGGNFYVYYTRDEDGKDTTPRIAIRMENGQVAEVRGINENQHLESELADIALAKLEDLPGGEAYIKKADDMKRLTAIEKKITHYPEVVLSQDEIAFLYELECPIEGFGYRKDPRIGELVEKRNLLNDMATLLGTDPENRQATIMALIESMIEGKYANLNIEAIIEQCSGLSTETALALINLGKSDIVGKNLTSFTGLSDEVAQAVIGHIRGIDIPRFTTLSEGTFFMLADEFSVWARHDDEGGRSYPWRLLGMAAAGSFDLPDHQEVVSRLMDKGYWSEAAKFPEYFDDLDLSAISDRLIAENHERVLVYHLKNFPNIDQEEFANYLLEKDPKQLAWDLVFFNNVDKSRIARKIIETGNIDTLARHHSSSKGLDSDIVEQLEAYREKMDAEEKARKEEWIREQEEQYRLEEERLANWDDTWGY